MTQRVFRQSLYAVLWGGLACGTLDITVALVVYGFMGTKPIDLLHFIASGALSAASFRGGFATAALGLFFEYAIAFTAAAAYVAMSRLLPVYFFTKTRTTQVFSELMGPQVGT